MEEGGGSERRGGPSRGRDEEFVCRSSRSFHPPKLFFQFGCCLNHITVCGVCEAADQRGTDGNSCHETRDLR